MFRSHAANLPVALMQMAASGETEVIRATKCLYPPITVAHFGGNAANPSLVNRFQFRRRPTRRVRARDKLITCFCDVNIVYLPTTSFWTAPLTVFD